VEQERPAADYRIKLSKEKIADHPIITIANSLIDSAAKERASDIHIEPKEQRTVIRFRIDGDMREMFTLKNKTGVMIISRLKILANMDIAEKRKPQDGAFAVVVGNTTYSLRLATTPTVYGESLIIRLLDPYARPKDLTELGMTEKQSNDLNHLVGHNQGLILIVGPTGSGKTTTIYSLLHKIDYKTRSIISVEDPVEYRISFVNQQQVGGRGGATFENLLKSVVRQDPDVLFLGEIRDAFSAKMAINFASTGHFSISTLHTTNATTALFRLERLEVDRLTMATSLIGIVAQKLLKKLCPHCKKIVTISEEERRMLSAFADEIPSEVAHPVGCSRCNNTGYSGREGIYEIITIDPAIEEMIRANAPIAKIREFIMGRGDYLISNHAFEKVKSLITSPRDAYEAVLIEEVDSGTPEAEMPAPGPVFPAPGAEDKTKILIVEDEPVTRKMLARILEKDGYIVAAASDGIDALLRMGKEKFHLILSDIDMPNLDGLRLLDLKNQKGIDAPVIFLTSKNRPEDERQGYLLGAVDYIKKPFEREPLLKKIQYALKKERENCE
jgi:type II secretory ATPase GspE/PulE/Tfp pilus assembly ATPase PilB-like protein/ActR/RegA family two-component response regulator